MEEVRYVYLQVLISVEHYSEKQCNALFRSGAVLRGSSDLNEYLNLELIVKDLFMQKMSIIQVFVGVE